VLFRSQTLLPTQRRVKGLNSFAKVKGEIIANIELGNICERARIIIIEDMAHDLLIGNDVLKKLTPITTDYKQKRLIIGDEREQTIIPFYEDCVAQGGYSEVVVTRNTRIWP